MEEKLLEDLKKAMKDGNSIDKNTIQYIRAQILRTSKDKQTKLTNKEIEDIIVQERKKRYEALALYEKGNRPDLMEQTYKELACINRYLPKVMTYEELEIEVQKIIDELNVDSNMFGQIMGVVKSRFGNRIDGKMASDILKKLLN